MFRIIAIVFAVLIGLHALIHLMGFVAYWPLGKVPELPYKTTLLNERWEIGATGMRIYGLFWLLAALAFLSAAIALGFGKPAWAPLLLAATLLSLALCILDWGVAFRGAIIDIVLLVVLFFVFGLRVPPAPFPPAPLPAGQAETQPLPGGLPAPVERYYRLVYGGQLPIYTSAVLSGRGTVRFMSVTMPARIRFSHRSGQDYRHYIETTFYGLPIMKVNETFIDGHTRLELPFGVVENDPGVDSAANQGLWSEMSFYPASLLTEQRARWEAIDAVSAKLFVPWGDGEQVFTVNFDPATGLIARIETLRYRDEKLGKLRWWGDFIYDPASVQPALPGQFALTWEDEGTPWLQGKIEDKVFNADLDAYIQQRGP